MPVRRLEAHSYAAENAGHVALMRGPILYCVESADNPGVDPRDLVFPAEAPPSEEPRPGLPGGVVILFGEGWGGRLYRTVPPGLDLKPSGPTELTAVPYYARVNRGAGPMRVWLRAR